MNTTALSYPVDVKADLAPGLSRWLWLASGCSCSRTSAALTDEYPRRAPLFVSRLPRRTAGRIGRMVFSFLYLAFRALLVHCLKNGFTASELGEDRVD